MYALDTQITEFTPAWSFSEIVGVATITIVRSTRIMKKPMTRENRAGQGLFSVVGAAAVAVVWVT
jgi:hypothetical protein